MRRRFLLDVDDQAFQYGLSEVTLAQGRCHSAPAYILRPVALLRRAT